MPSWIGPWELGILLLVIPYVFYFLALSKALRSCSASNRRLSPDLVWLQFIPVFGLAWQFVVVLAVSRSLGGEFRSRGIAEEPYPARALGLTTSILQVCAPLIPGLVYLGGGASSPVLLAFYVVGFAYLVVWIVFWAKIHGLSHELWRSAQSGLVSGQHGYQLQPRPKQGSRADRFCRNCGASVEGKGFCTQCGAKQ